MIKESSGNATHTVKSNCCQHVLICGRLNQGKQLLLTPLDKRYTFVQIDVW